MSRLNEYLEAVKKPTHQLKIAIDTVKNPLKGKFLGGPSEEEAIEILKNKFGYSDDDIKKLKETK